MASGRWVNDGIQLTRRGHATIYRSLEVKTMTNPIVLRMRSGLYVTNKGDGTFGFTDLANCTRYRSNRQARVDIKALRKIGHYGVQRLNLTTSEGKGARTNENRLSNNRK